MTYEVDFDQSTIETNWAEFDALWPDYAQSVQVIPPRGDLKKRAISLLDESEYKNGWNKHAQRRYIMKRHKLKMECLDIGILIIPKLIKLKN